MKTEFITAAKFKAADKANKGALVITLSDEKKLPETAAALDKTTGGAISKAIAASRFEGKKKQIITILAPAGIGFAQILLVGVGKAKDACHQCYESAGGAVVAELNKLGVKEATLLALTPKAAKVSEAEARIAAASQAAQNEIEAVAAEAAQDIVARVSGASVTSAEAQAAVKAALNG